MKRLLAVCLLAMCLAPSTALAASAQWQASPNGQMYARPAAGADSVGVIVRFKQPSTAPLQAHLLSSAAGTTAKPMNPAHGLYSFATPVDQTPEQYSLQLMLNSPGVASADPNYVRHIDAYVAPTDPDFTDATTWSDGIGYYVGAKHWWLDAINAPPAWQIGQGSTYPVRATAADIKVAVLDMGFYLNHQEFNGGTVTAGKDEFASYDPSTGVYATDSDVTPDVTTDTVTMSHGTATAASVGAEVNGVGMVGAGWNPQVVGYKVAGPLTAAWGGYPAGTVLMLDGAIANGIYDAVDSGCKVINMSLGSSSPSMAFQDAVTYAHAHGVVVCASAGNDSNATVNYPAACTYATAVAAVCRSGGSWTTNGAITRASFSD
ncbi:MAG: S8 family serine peptidase, partial [Coriobacteriia bacterium]|nr:S8 family serine peptidase [Coriobacteriia bacterium]